MNRFASRNPEDLPESFYNIKADLPEPPKPPLHPGNEAAARAGGPGAGIFQGLYRPGDAASGTSPSRTRCARPIRSTGRRRSSMPRA